MPDDLSHLGYCGFCKRIHERDIDGYVCDDTRPLPIARVPKPSGWLRRFATWMRSLLRL